MNWLLKKSEKKVQPKKHNRVNGILPTPQRKRKATIPVAFREQIWLRDCGKVYDAKCKVTWCQNRMTVYDFQAGHNIPESRGGQTVPDNLIPICARCNTSMGNRYTINEWNRLSKPVAAAAVAPSPEESAAPTSQPSLFHRLCSCFT